MNNIWTGFNMTAEQLDANRQRPVFFLIIHPLLAAYLHVTPNLVFKVDISIVSSLSPNNNFFVGDVLELDATVVDKPSLKKK